jgi:riboflavin synthase
MFTGIVEETGTVQSWKGETLRIAASLVLEGTRLGDSIAVEGACLTVTGLGADWFAVGVSPETMRRTSLGERRTGDRVNLERALAAGQRMGGHYVQGHVDGTATILDRQLDGSSLRLTFSAPASLERYIVEKGFIAIDGVSLTVTETATGRFGVMLVEYTQQAVTLPGKPVGAAVNLEVDVLAKYVERLMEARFGTAAPR